MVGAIEERGRLPGSTRFATALPSFSGAKEKSVSWLFRMKPPTIWREPKAFSTDVVIESTLPSPSTMTKWLVAGMSNALPSSRSSALSQGGSPAVTWSSGRAVGRRISAARVFR